MATIDKYETNENESLDNKEASSYKGFNNKYLKAALLAVGSYYLAKKDPYVLEGINKVKDKLEEADAQNRSDYIKSSASSIGKVIAENRARRKERLVGYKEKIKNLTQYTKDPYIAASIIKDDLYSEMMKFGKQGKDITTLYNVTDNFKNQARNLTPAELASSLAGPVDNISKNLNTKFLAPKRGSFISNFISGTAQEDVSEEVKAQIQAITPDEASDDIEDIIVGGGGLTEKGKRFLTPKVTGALTESRAQKQIMDAIAKSLGGTVKINKDDSGAIIYSYDSEIEKRLEKAGDVTGDLLLEVENLMIQQGYTRREAVQIVINKYKLGSSDTTYSPIKGVINNKGTGNNKSTSSVNKTTSISLPKTSTAVQDSLLDLKSNPPKGQGNKIDTTAYNRQKSNLKAKLKQVLTQDKNSPYFNDVSGADKYINDFISKNKI